MVTGHGRPAVVDAWHAAYLSSVRDVFHGLELGRRCHRATKATLLLARHDAPCGLDGRSRELAGVAGVVDGATAVGYCLGIFSWGLAWLGWLGWLGGVEREGGSEGRREREVVCAAFGI